MKQLLPKILLAVVSFCVFFLVVDLAYGYVVKRIDQDNLHQVFGTHFEDKDRNKVIGLEGGIKAGLAIPMAAELTPRPRFIWAPSSTFYLCYTGIRQPYFDDRGCVRNDINSRQLREREELMGPKPKGQKRILCLGDSFTFGWGVRIEDAWPRRVERNLRRDDDGIRTINAGASGTMQVDEYEWALTKRFYDLEPDAVVVTLCLNDLLPTNSALGHFNEIKPWYNSSNILTSLFSRYELYDRLQIPEERDLVQQLLDAPEGAYQFVTWVQGNGGYEVFWAGKGPQKALVNIRDWCKKKRVPFGVVIWPYFQGLGPQEHYPFTKIHKLVAAFCAEKEIPFLDLLPTFLGKRETPDYWVSPADSHGNHLAHEDATEPITVFFKALMKSN